MLSIIDTTFWVGLFQIMIVNILLSGDNAVVIAMAARNLHHKQQKQAIVWGSLAAVIMRIILTLFAVSLLTLPYLKLIGGIMLMWIAMELLVPQSEGKHVNSASNIWNAVKIILWADLTMSLDNVLGVAAAAKGDSTLLIAGLILSIPIIMFGSQIVMKAMDKFPFLVTGGAALLGFVAGEMIISDSGIQEYLIQIPDWIVHSTPYMIAATVVLCGIMMKKIKA